jgi:putative ABC transport system permease protein
MSKGKISSILLIETIIIGLGSLFVGLIVGIGLSQLMSAVVVTLFEADMTAYQFTVSGDAIMKTILYFAVMYLVVMIFNSMVISRFKLIDLMQSGRKSEKIKLKNPVLCVLVFILAAIALGLAYYQVGWQYNKLTQIKLLVCIAVGAASTFLIFWSVSGLLLRIMMSAKNAYYRGLNSFTFRQISSKVNTMVFSMTVICLMLFVTICTEQDFDILSYLDDSVHFGIYRDDSFTFADFCGSEIERITDEYGFLIFDTPEDVIRLSDYNKLMELYGKEQLSLKDDQFILLGNYKYMVGIRNSVLENVHEITVFGKKLKSKYKECQDGFIDLAVQPLNTGLFVVPDSVVDGQFAISDYLIGNYAANSKEDKKAMEKSFRNEWNNKVVSNFADLPIHEAGGSVSINTKIDIASAAISLGAIVTFLGLYIGLVFLIACGAILALKELSESVDSIGRYEMLRKIGVEESDISKSLFRQTGIFFLLPFLLSCIHSVFGMKFAMFFLEVFGTEKMISSIFATSIVILLIYGGYFLITYFCSKGIIKDRK